MALAGYTEDRSALWREISSSLKEQLIDPYLRAMFNFLTTEDTNYDDILVSFIVIMLIICIILLCTKLLFQFKQPVFII